MTMPDLTPREAPRPFWMPDTKGFLAIAMIALFAAVIFMLLMFKTSPADPAVFAVVTTLVGVLAGEVKEVYSYYFGSSASSSAKDATINSMLPPVTNPVALEGQPKP